MLFRQTLLAAAVGLMSAAAVAAPVTTQGTGVGKHGDMTVAVTFDNGRIQAIEIVKEAENPVLAKKVYTDLKAAVIASNSADLDAISGATFSSKGFLDAVKDAAKKAGVTLSKADAKAIKKVVKNIPAVSNYDVVVIGAGGAGFSAAIEAKNAGANVVLLEKMPAVGGNSLISGAEMNAARNWVQPKLGILDDSAERHAADTFKGGDKKGDMKVINVMTANALDAAKWCRDYLGVRFEDDNLFFFGGHSRKRALIPVGHTGTEFIAKFQAKADELGIPVITDMKAEELIKDKTGRVVGVKATSHGATYTFTAKGGVVLATGGFGANKAMVKKYNPKIDERFKTTDAPGTTGEALYMAKRAGALLAAVARDEAAVLAGCFIFAEVVHGKQAVVRAGLAAHGFVRGGQGLKRGGAEHGSVHVGGFARAFGCAHGGLVAVARQQGRAIGAHVARDIGAHGMHAGELFEGAQHGIVEERATLYDNFRSDFFGVANFNDLEQGVLDNGNGQARGDIAHGGAFFLSLLHTGVHEYGAAAAQIDRIFGGVRGFRELGYVEVQARSEALDEAAAARRACLVEHDVVDNAVFHAQALHVLAADVENELDARQHFLCAAKVRDGFDFAGVDA